MCAHLNFIKSIHNYNRLITFSTKITFLVFQYSSSTAGTKDPKVRPFFLEYPTSKSFSIHVPYVKSISPCGSINANFCKLLYLFVIFNENLLKDRVFLKDLFLGKGRKIYRNTYRMNVISMQLWNQNKGIQCTKEKFKSMWERETHWNTEKLWSSI